MRKIIFVFCGGFLGAILRSIIYDIPLKKIDGIFPINEIIVNVLGCFMLSYITNLVKISINSKSNFKIDDDLYSAITTGLIGAFAAFSTFSKDLSILLMNEDYIHGFSYIVISILGSLIVVAFGYHAAVYTSKILSRS